MSQDVEQLLFQSDIVANIDTKSAHTKLNNLIAKADKAALEISIAFNVLGGGVRDVASAATSVATVVDETKKSVEALNAIVGGDVNLGTGFAKSINDVTNAIGPAQKFFADLKTTLYEVKDAANAAALSIENAEAVLGSYEKRKRELAEATNEHILKLRDEADVLRASLSNYQSRNYVLQEQIDKLDKEVYSLKELIKRLEELSHIHGPVIDNQNKLRDAMKLTKSMADSLVSSLSKGFSLERARKGDVGYSELYGRAQQGVATAFKAIRREWAEADIEISKYAGEIQSFVLRLAEEQGRMLGYSAQDVEALIEVWRKVFQELVGASIIPELINKMAYYLNKRTAEILDEHQKIIDDKLLAGWEKTSGTAPNYVTQTIWSLHQLTEALHDAEKQQMLGMEGYTTDAKQLLEHVKKYWDENRLEILKTYRELEGISKDSHLAQIEAQFAQQGKSIIAIIEQVNTGLRNLGRPLIGQKGVKVTAIDQITSRLTKFVDFMLNLPYKIFEVPETIIAQFTKVPTAIDTTIDRFINNVAKKISGLPPLVVRDIIGLAHQLGALKSSFANAGKGIARAFLDAVKLKPGQILLDDIDKALGPLEANMVHIGQNAGRALIHGIEAAIDSARISLIPKVRDMAQAVGKHFTTEFRLLAGSWADILSGKSFADQLRSGYARAGALGQLGAQQQYRDQMTQAGIDIQEYQYDVEHAMRAVSISTKDAMRDVVGAIHTATMGTIPFRQSMAGITTAVGRLLESAGLYATKTEDIDRRIADSVKRSRKALGIMVKDGEKVDRHLERLGARVAGFGERLKVQHGIFTQLHEKERRLFKQQINASKQWIVAYEAVASASKAGITSADKAFVRIYDNFMKAAKRMKDLGLGKIIADAISVEGGELYDQQAAAATKAGVLDQAKFMSARYEEASKSVVESLGAIDNEFEKMRTTQPKIISQLGRAIMDVDFNATHFITTLRDGGQISTERLQDMQLHLEHLVLQMNEMRKQTTGWTTEQKKYFDEVMKSVLLEAETFQLLAQRSIAAQKRQEMVEAAAKKVKEGIKGIGDAARDNIPIIGTKAKEAAKELREITEESGAASEFVNDIGLALGDLDPAFQGIVDGAGNMGDVFGGAMGQMAEVAQVKGATVAKSLTLIKVAAAAIVGIFGALIISTGKLAAEVTTLGITMRVVAENVGYNVEHMEHLVKVLKETGITTRASITALTQFMRAKLPIEWFDPIKEATVNIQDLARAAQTMAVAMGEDSSESMSRLIDFVITGNSQLLDTLGIMKNASQMYEEYAVAIGKTAKQLTVQEKRIALLTGIMREAETTQGVYTEAMKSASKQLGSMRRLIEELRLEWGKQFEPVLALVIFRFNELLKFLTGIPEKTKSVIAQFILLAVAISGITLAVTTLIPKLWSLFTMVLKPMIGLFISKFGILLALLAVVGTALYKVFIKIPSDKQGIEGMVDRVNTLIDSFGGLKEALQKVGDWLRNFGRMVKVHFMTIVNRTISFINRLRDSVSNFFMAHPEIAAWVERVKTIFQDLFTLIYHVVDLTLGAIESLMAGDLQAASEKIKKVAKLIAAWIFLFLKEVVVQVFKWGVQLVVALAKGMWAAAKKIIPQVLTAIGNMIASFFKGASPPKEGPLSEIDLWGKQAAETFMSGFANADFDILDTALGEIESRFTQSMQGLSRIAEEAARQVIDKLSKIRQGATAAIFSFGTPGGPFDMRGMESGVRETFGRYTERMGALVNAIIGGMQSGSTLLDLQSKLGMAGKLSKKVAGAAAKMLEQIQSEAKRVEYQMGLIERQIKEEADARIAAAGIVIDERLLARLQRQLERANVEVSKAQRRIDAIRATADRYGVNILTWEEINAKAQLDLAERERDRVQASIEEQDELQRRAEDIRADVAIQYQDELDALQRYKDALEARSADLQMLVDELESSMGDPMADPAEALSKIAEDVEEAGGELGEAIDDFMTAFKPPPEGFPEDPFPELEIKIPDFSGAFKTALEGIELSIELGIPKLFQGMIDKVQEKLDEIAGWFKETQIGKWLTDSGYLDLWTTSANAIVGVLEALWRVIEDIIGLVGGMSLGVLEVVLGEKWAQDPEKWKKIFDAIGSSFEALGWALETILNMVHGLLSTDWSAFLENLAELLRYLGMAPDEVEETTSAVGAAIEAGQHLPEMTPEEIQTIQDPSGIGAGGGLGIIPLPKIDIEAEFAPVVQWYQGMPEVFRNVAPEITDAITLPFRNAARELVDRSIVPEMADEIVRVMLSIPARMVLRLVDFLNAGAQLAGQIYEGFKEKISGVTPGSLLTDLGTWLTSLALQLIDPEQLATFFESAATLGDEIRKAFENMIFEPAEGLWESLTTWLSDLATEIGDEAGDVVKLFITAGTTIATKMMDALMSGIRKTREAIKNTVKGIWNKALRPAFRGVLRALVDGINGVIRTLNRAARALENAGISLPGFPLDRVQHVDLPSLQGGGLTLTDTMAQLHAGEIIVPLEKLGPLLRNALGGMGMRPVFSPTMNFYPGASPQTIAPAVSSAFGLYEDYIARGG